MDLFNGFTMSSLSRGEATPKACVIASSNVPHTESERYVILFSSPSCHDPWAGLKTVWSISLVGHSDYTIHVGEPNYQVALFCWQQRKGSKLTKLPAKGHDMMGI